MIFHVPSIRPILVTLCLILIVHKGFSQKAFRVKFQDWIEDDDRIRVRSWYAEAETPINSNWDIGIVGMVDSISGATPMGRPPTANKSDWLAYLEEERRAGVINLSQKGEEYDFSFEFGISDEPDYLSRNYAARVSKGLASDTLTLHAGISYNDDEVDSGVPGGPNLGIQTRKTPELMLGVHRVLDPQSTIALNLTYGQPKGYLSDPYKQIGLTETLFPGDPILEKEVFYLYPENRPDERETFVAYLEGTRYFKDLDGSVEASYRFFSDNDGLEGHTYEIQWFQRLGEKFVLRPLYRFYHQKEVDFYNVTLDGTGVSPVTQPSGNSPYYSADYRLSKLHSSTYGLKLTYFHRQDLIFDFAFDQYRMKGKDGVTSQRVYPDAQVFTLGAQWEF